MSMTKAKMAVIYCRISDDKAGESLGVQRQQEDCETLAKSLGWTVAQTIIENDRSAYSGRARPGYQQLLAGLRDGTFDGVLAWHSDRLHRRPIELEEYIHVCQARGIRTQTVKGGEIDLATPEGMLRAGMLGQIARYESAHKSDRITRAHQQAAEAGKWRGGGRPFGYLADATTPHPEEAPAIVNAYEGFLAGKSLGELTRSWNEQGLRSVRGKPFTVIAVRTILLRERNMGASIYKGEIVKRGAFDAIVSEETFAEAKAILANPARRNPGSTRARWFLSGLGLCGICAANGEHAKMGASSATDRAGKSIAVYKCRAKHHMGRRAQYVDDFISKVVLARLSRSDATNLLHLENKTDLKALRKEADGYRTKLSDYAVMLAGDAMTPAQFGEATAITRAQLAAVNKKMFAPGQNPDVVALITSPDPQVMWTDMVLSKKRGVIDALMVVTVLPTDRKSSRFFHPEFIDVAWREVVPDAG